MKSLKPSKISDSKSKIYATNFRDALLIWFEKNGRKNLPWQHPRTPYTVWISEIMLQQTQVKTVIPYYLKFIERFPDLKTLANASEDDVLAYWSGLGYYSRGRNIHKSAQTIIKTHQGIFPSDYNTLISLPGIGASTACAILSLAFQKPAAILDGNVKRILSRYFLLAGNIQKAAVKRTFEAHAKACLSQENPADYTQAIMDLGALVCTPKKPNCMSCPMSKACGAYQNKLIHAYPEKIIKKALPVREAQFLVLHNQTKRMIYLEKQPDKGIWGGLWSLPKLDLESCAYAYIESTHGGHVLQNYPLPPIKHTFTHFKLMLHPKALTIDAKQSRQLLPETGRWYNVENVMALGLAKPIRDIIKSFLSKDDAFLCA